MPIISEKLIFSRATKGTYVFQNPNQSPAISTLYIKKGCIDDRIKHITITVEEVDKDS